MAGTPQAAHIRRLGFNYQMQQKTEPMKLYLSALLLLVGSLSFSTDADAKEPKWAPLEIVNVQALPWDKSPRFGADSKTFFRGPEGTLIFARWSPSWTTKMPTAGAGLGSHYHLWNEWAYMLKGDLVIQEPVSPYQKNGAMYRYVEGTWLDRPAYTLHGGGWVTGGLRSQNPTTLILYEEGDGSVVSIGPNGDHFKPDFPEKPVPYEPDWRAVKKFQRPWIVHSASDLEWETDPQVAGRLVKWLSDDTKEGFRAQLVKIPPGWTAPEGSRKTYFQKGSRMRYVLFGDMQVLSFDDPNSAGAATRVTEDYFIFQPTGSIWGYGGGPVSEHGAIWLEVTYADGVAHGGGPIEDAVEIN